MFTVNVVTDLSIDNSVQSWLKLYSIIKLIHAFKFLREWECNTCKIYCNKHKHATQPKTSK